MVSGVTYSLAIVIGNLIGQACDKIVPPSCTVLHGDQNKLLMDEAVAKEQTFLSRILSREDYFAQRESAHLERYQMMQGQIASLEEDIAQGEEKFLNSQSSLINTYDEKLTKIQDQAHQESIMQIEKIEDLTGELQRLNDLLTERKNEADELCDNHKRAISLLNAKLKIIQSVLSQRNAALLELMALKDGNEISEGRTRQLLDLFKEEIEQMEKKNLCIVCCTNDKEILLLPCKHHHLCSNCADAVSICPYCRSNITQRMKVYS